MAMVRTVVLWIPGWPVLAAQCDENLPEAVFGAPLALIHKGVVAECSPEARALGLRVGMKRRDAQMRCPGLIVVPDLPERNRRIFDSVLITLQNTVPQHTLLEPGMLAYRARGVSRFYGGEEAAAQAVISALHSHRHSFPSRVGISDDVFSAVMAARSMKPEHPIRIVPPGGAAAFLAGLPVDVLDDGPAVSLLKRLGVNTLGDCVALGEEALRERFGTTGEMMYRLASGRDGTWLSPEDSPVDTSDLIELPEPLHLVDQLAFSIRHATEEYHQRLLGAGVVCTRVRITIGFDTAAPNTRTWLHPRFFSPRELVDRVRWQLEHVARESSSGGEYAPGVVSVRFEALDPEGINAHEAGLWGQGPDTRVHHVISRVQSMVGANGVLSAHSTPSRFAGGTAVAGTWGEKAPDVGPTGPLPGALPEPFPGTVFAIPPEVLLQDCRGRDLVLENGDLSGVPAYIVFRDRHLDLVSWAGPWPVSERWWDPQRARYAHRLQVLDDRGMGWLLSASQENQWRIEARYD
jgi:protein ImuB